MKKRFSKEIYLPKQKKIENIIHSFSSSERFLFWIIVIVLITSSFSILGKLNKNFIVETPRKGGEITEGVIGSPRFINPLLARSKADKDLTSLIYSGLMKMDPNKGITTSLAKNYKISENGLVYTFELRDNIFFQDGEKITAKDIVFTIEKAKDPALESPQRANWNGVEVKKIDEKTISFTLQQPYSPFIQNTTIGIIPKHIWGDIPPKQFSFSRFNIEPVGSGPFKIKSVKRDSSGMPKNYKLESFKKFVEGEPYINSITLYFYPSQEKLIEGYENKEIKQFHGVSAKNTLKKIKSDSKIIDTPLPRVFSLFFNQNKADIFTNYKIRKSINLAIDKKEIIKNVFSGYATAIENPIPFWILKQKKEGEKDSVEERRKKAKENISSLGWNFDEEDKIFKKESGEENKELKFSITTSNTPELKETADIIKKQLKEIGILVDIEVFEANDLNQNAIRPRNYESLLFGEVIGPGIDLYPFWHSSNQNDPGLNMAMYTNITVDKLLEEIRETKEEKRLKNIYNEISEEISSEQPSVFLYTPHFTYVVENNLKGVLIEGMSDQKDRFMNIHKWYINTQKVWEFFKEEEF